MTATYGEVVAAAENGQNVGVWTPTVANGRVRFGAMGPEDWMMRVGLAPHDVPTGWDLVAGRLAECPWLGIEVFAPRRLAAAGPDKLPFRLSFTAEKANEALELATWMTRVFQEAGLREGGPLSWMWPVGGANVCQVAGMEALKNRVGYNPGRVHGVFAGPGPAVPEPAHSAEDILTCLDAMLPGWLISDGRFAYETRSVSRLRRLRRIMQGFGVTPLGTEDEPIVWLDRPRAQHVVSYWPHLREVFRVVTFGERLRPRLGEGVGMGVGRRRADHQSPHLILAETTPERLRDALSNTAGRFEVLARPGGGALLRVDEVAADPI